MTRSSITLLSAALLAGAGAVWVGPASAQTSPETQTCGGLLCDIGVFGHKVPAAPVALTPEPPAKQAQTAAVVSPPAMPPVVVEPPHKTVKRNVAKIAARIAIAKPSATKAPVMKASAPMAPRAAAAMPAKAPGMSGADAGPRPPSPVDMFRPIY